VAGPRLSRVTEWSFDDDSVLSPLFPEQSRVTYWRTSPSGNVAALAHRQGLLQVVEGGRWGKQAKGSEGVAPCCNFAPKGSALVVGSSSEGFEW